MDDPASFLLRCDRWTFLGLHDILWDGDKDIRIKAASLLRNFPCASLGADKHHLLLSSGDIGDSVVSESALRSAGTLLLRVRTPQPMRQPDGGP
ncbi:hypothetical protein PoB_005432400 [Plakobranchus ocellatus]|uniref:Uncharacterized protein n=1 Tax=Plakobranchus ocellatus TaxID=259542 RepID=A0AAV4C9T0_9GAST|nr:hypothetical protein PoB_005432400 [Plakobranchus ocellatus]